MNRHIPLESRWKVPARIHCSGPVKAGERLLPASLSRVCPISTIHAQEHPSFLPSLVRRLPGPRRSVQPAPQPRGANRRIFICGPHQGRAPAVMRSALSAKIGRRAYRRPVPGRGGLQTSLVSLARREGDSLEEGVSGWRSRDDLVSAQFSVPHGALSSSAFKRGGPCPPHSASRARFSLSYFPLGQHAR